MDVLLGLKDAIESTRGSIPRRSADGSTSSCSRVRTSTTVGIRRTFTKRSSCRSSRRPRVCSTSTSTKWRPHSTTEAQGSDHRRRARARMSGSCGRIEEKIDDPDSGKQSFRQEIVRKAMGAFKRGDKFTLDSHAPLHDAIGSTSSSSGAMSCGWSAPPRGPRRNAAEDLDGRRSGWSRLRLRRTQRREALTTSPPCSRRIGSCMSVSALTRWVLAGKFL